MRPSCKRPRRGFADRYSAPGRKAARPPSKSPDGRGFSGGWPRRARPSRGTARHRRGGTGTAAIADTPDDLAWTADRLRRPRRTNARMIWGSQVHDLGPAAFSRRRARLRVRLDHDLMIRSPFAPRSRGQPLQRLRCRRCCLVRGRCRRAAQSVPIVRDAEIEALVRDYARPILQAAGLSKSGIKIILVNDRASTPSSTGAASSSTPARC